jgi:hypothetical protein
MGLLLVYSLGRISNNTRGLNEGRYSIRLYASEFYVSACVRFLGLHCFVRFITTENLIIINRFVSRPVNSTSCNICHQLRGLICFRWFSFLI